MKPLDLTIKLAQNISDQKYRCAAIVTDKRNRILSIGINSFIKTHPIQAKYAKMTGHQNKIYLHAEIDALVKCNEKPYAIYIARVDKSDNTRLAKPCEVCNKAIEEAKIKQIHYTIDP